MSNDFERFEVALDRVERLASGTPDPSTSPDMADALEILRRRALAIVDSPQKPPDLTLSSSLWCAALRVQAGSDLRAATALAKVQGHPGAVTMLLQMTFEKFAKAAQAKRDPQQFKAKRFSHAVATTVIGAMVRKLGSRWKDPARLALRITAAHPSVTKKGPHLEYPWEQGAAVCVPDDHLPVVQCLFDPRSFSVFRVIGFADYLLSDFDSVV